MKLDSVDLYFADIKDFYVLSREEEIELINQIKAGNEEAKEKFLNCNLKFVVNIAKRYLNLGVPFQDLIQEGNIGLIKALEKFDPNKSKFTTYSAWWIKQCINRAIENTSRAIRLPAYLQTKINAYNKTKTMLQSKCDRIIKVEDVAEEMGITLDMACLYETFSKNILSLDKSIKNDEEDSLMKLLPSNEETTEDHVINNFLKDEIIAIIDSLDLSQRDYNILMLRYGLDGNAPKSLKEITKEINISMEGARIVELRLLKKLRKSQAIKKLAIYLDYPEKAIRRLEELKNDDKSIKKKHL